MNTWHPIETAPKDNRYHLYLAKFSDSGKLLDLDFDGTWEDWSEHFEGSGWVSWKGIQDPTHWAYQTGAPPNR